MKILNYILKNNCKFDDVPENYFAALAHFEALQFELSKEPMDKALASLKVAVANYIYYKNKKNALEFFTGFVSTFGTVMSVATMTPLAYVAVGMLTSPITGVNVTRNIINYYLFSPPLENCNQYLDDEQKQQVSAILYLRGMIHFKNGDYQQAEKLFQTSVEFYRQKENDAALIYCHLFINRVENKSNYVEKINNLVRNGGLLRENILLLQLLLGLFSEEPLRIENAKKMFDEISYDSVDYENPLLLLISMQMMRIFFAEKQSEKAVKTFNFAILHLNSSFFNADEKRFILEEIIVAFTFDQSNHHDDLKLEIVKYIGDEAIKIKRNKFTVTTKDMFLISVKGSISFYA